MDIMQIKEKAKIVKEKIGLSTSIVGVKLIFPDKRLEIPDAKILHGYRYCQAVMMARHGEHVILNKEDVSCPAAANAFGFKPLPEGLKSGKGLIGFGITKQEITGKEMFEGMTILKPGEIDGLYLFPLESAVMKADIVIVEDQVEKLMWIALAYINLKNGKRIESSTAVLQATCVDATLIPYKENKMNLSYGCYGCREATDIGYDEGVLGFPFSNFEKIAEYVKYLAEKAIPNSRSKKAFNMLRKKIEEKNSKDKGFSDESMERREKMSLPEKYSKWKGIPREEIDWAPKIDESKCVGCGMCVTSCGRDVFDYDWERKKAIVARPLQCMVGCTSCEVWCIFDAISFPDPQYVKDLIKSRKILALAKKQLEERRK